MIGVNASEEDDQSDSRVFVNPKVHRADCLGCLCRWVAFADSANFATSSHVAIHPVSTSSTLMNCGVDIPAVKCNPSLYTPSPTTPGAPSPVTVPAPAVNTPGPTTCGEGFFSSQELADFSCSLWEYFVLQFAGLRSMGRGWRWMLTTSYVTPPPATAGGGIVVVGKPARRQIPHV